MDESLTALVDDLYRLIDTDDSGNLDLREWRQVCTALASVSENFNDTEESFEAADTNGDGLISIEEFRFELGRLCDTLGARQFRTALEKTTDTVQKQKTQREIEKIREIFRSADKDGSGKVDDAELRFCLQQCFLDEELDPDEAFFEMDDDYSGEVDYEEFLRFFESRKDLTRKLSCVLESQGAKADRAAVFLVAAAPWLLCADLVPASWPQGSFQEFPLMGSLGEGTVDLCISPQTDDETNISGIIGEVDFDLTLRREGSSSYAPWEASGQIGEGSFTATFARKAETVIEVTGSIGSSKLALTYEKLEDGFRVGGKFQGVVALQGRQLQSKEDKKRFALGGTCCQEDLKMTITLGDSESIGAGHIGDSDIELTVQF